MLAEKSSNRYHGMQGVIVLGINERGQKPSFCGRDSLFGERMQPPIFGEGSPPNMGMVWRPPFHRDRVYRSGPAVPS